MNASELVFIDRYAAKDSEGNPIETSMEQMDRRVAWAVAAIEPENIREEIAEQFYWAIAGERKRFVPGGRILSSMGLNSEATAYNCYVHPMPKDSREGIMQSIAHLVETQSRGGGVGVNLSSLRPYRARVRGVNGYSSGPLAWAELYSQATGCVIQGGSRRGATMIMLDDWHPDVYVPREKRDPGQTDFIDVKRDLRKITNANLSICISDAFMQAVKNDADWDLVFPDTSDPDYDRLWDGNLESWRARGKPVIVYRTVKARDMWNAICHAAWLSGEPGVVFMERYRKMSNTWYCEDIRCVNPCGEQGLGPWSVCLLGAVNLGVLVKDNQVDWESLRKVTAIAVRFLDNVIDLTPYINPENEETQRFGIRRMGIGTMGLADLLLQLGIRYGSDEAVDLTRKIFRTMRDAAYRASVELAKERGPFPWFDRDQYLQGEFIKRLPEDIRADIAKHGIRNAVLLTQAPTGTTSLLVGASSGIEPLFSFKFKHRTAGWIVNPIYQRWLDEHPGEPLPDYFVTANDLTPEEHVRMQAAAQEFIDSSISKTVNAPREHTVEDVRTLYMLAYDLGCKGITYFREGSREQVLTREEQPKEKPVQQNTDAESRKPRQRPSVMSGVTVRKPTPLGNMYVTINFNGGGKPFEVFAQIGKAGSDVTAFTEALARLISLGLRSGVDPQEIINQLEGIGGSQSIGFGPSRVRSVPDAMARALEDALARTDVSEEPIVATSVLSENGTNGKATGSPKQSGDLCTECGSPMVFEEGCAKCYSCGASQC